MRVSVSLATVGTVAGALGGVWWAFDLARHFVVYYLAGGLVGVVLGAMLKQRVWTAVAGLVSIYAVFLLLPYFGRHAGPAHPRQDTLRIVHFNVLTANDDREATLEWLRSREADLVFLQEPDKAFLTMLADGLPEYRIEAARPRPDNYGIALLMRTDLPASKLESVRTQIDRFRAPGRRRIPRITMHARFDGRDVSLLYLHATPPVSAAFSDTRRRELERAAQWSTSERARGNAPVVLGDLNATPFCDDFDLLTDAGLVDSARARGYVGTYPSFLPTLASLPIDHVLHDPSLMTLERHVGPRLGSDHRPVEVVLAWSE